jgi:predicted RNA-binding protein (virulence factor B family)
MARLGEYATLRVNRLVDFGAYLDAGSLGEVLLPRKYEPEGLQVNDPLDVFLYLDSEDRPVATTEQPYACVGEFAALRVETASPLGAFLDWNLTRGLMLPFREQRQGVRQGETVVVFVDWDAKSGRIVASRRVERYLDAGPGPHRQGDEVELLIYGESDLGYKAIVMANRRLDEEADARAQAEADAQSGANSQGQVSADLSGDLAGTSAATDPSRPGTETVARTSNGPLASNATSSTTATSASEAPRRFRPEGAPMPVVAQNVAQDSTQDKAPRAETGSNAASESAAVPDANTAPDAASPRPLTGYHGKDDDVAASPRPLTGYHGKDDDVAASPRPLTGYHGGVMYWKETFRQLREGERVRGFIRQVREDGKLDLTLEAPGHAKVEEFSDTLLSELKRLREEQLENARITPSRLQEPLLELNDSSDPEAIYLRFGVSKKTFKRATGILLRQRLIDLADDGIRLREPAAGAPQNSN